MVKRERAPWDQIQLSIQQSMGTTHNSIIRKVGNLKGKQSLPQKPAQRQSLWQAVCILIYDFSTSMAQANKKKSRPHRHMYTKVLHIQIANEYNVECHHYCPTAIANIQIECNYGQTSFPPHKQRATRPTRNKQKKIRCAHPFLITQNDSKIFQPVLLSNL